MHQKNYSHQTAVRTEAAPTEPVQKRWLPRNSHKVDARFLQKPQVCRHLFRLEQARCGKKERQRALRGQQN